MTEKVLVKAVSVLPSAGEPGGDRRLTVAEDPLGRGSIQSFSQRCQHDRDLLGRGFQPVQGRVKSSTEGSAAGLTPKGLDLLGLAVPAVANESMNVCVCDAEVGALMIGAGEAVRVYALGCSSPAFDLAPRPHRQR